MTDDPIPADGAFVQSVLGRLESHLAAVRDASVAAELTSITFAVSGFRLNLPHRHTGCVLWRRPGEGTVLLGGGCAREFVPEAGAPMDALRRTAAVWRGAWRHRDADATGVRPLAFFGFDFFGRRSDGTEGLPPARLWVPTVLLARRQDRQYVTFTASGADLRRPDVVSAAWRRDLRALLAPGAGAGEGAGEGAGMDGDRLRVTSAPGGEPRSAWEGRVAQALEAIDAGVADKLVVTRQAVVRGNRPFDVAAVADCLSETYPDCTTVVVSTPPGTLVAATPEKLASLHGRVATCDALAGTSPSGAAGLGETAKDREEHGHVVTAIRAALAPLAAALDHPPVPQVRRLAGLQHLHTPIRADLAGDSDILDLAARLHPTPAVGGTPRPAALRWLAARGERRDAWYTGGVGWMDAAGDGEAVVVLRCGWLAGDTALLSAGAGIVAGSSPAAEWEETELKLGTLRMALEYG